MPQEVRLTGPKAIQASRSPESPAPEELHFRREGNSGVQRVDRPTTARVAQAAQVGTRGPRRIDVDQPGAPVGVHVRLAVRRLDHHEIELPRKRRI